MLKPITPLQLVVAAGDNQSSFAVGENRNLVIDKCDQCGHDLLFVACEQVESFCKMRAG